MIEPLSDRLRLEDELHNLLRVLWINAVLFGAVFLLWASLDPIVALALTAMAYLVSTSASNVVRAVEQARQTNAILADRNTVAQFMFSRGTDPDGLPVSGEEAWRKADSDIARMIDHPLNDARPGFIGKSGAILFGIGTDMAILAAGAATGVCFRPEVQVALSWFVRAVSGLRG